jgi:hypothetical protein
MPHLSPTTALDDSRASPSMRKGIHLEDYQTEGRTSLRQSIGKALNSLNPNSSITKTPPASDPLAPPRPARPAKGLYEHSISQSEEEDEFLSLSEALNVLNLNMPSTPSTLKPSSKSTHPVQSALVSCLTGTRSSCNTQMEYPLKVSFEAVGDFPPMTATSSESQRGQFGLKQQLIPLIAPSLIPKSSRIMPPFLATGPKYPERNPNPKDLDAWWGALEPSVKMAAKEMFETLSALFDSTYPCLVPQDFGEDDVLYLEQRGT